MYQLQPTDPEPPCGSILMVFGDTGTAVQRFFSDGLYHLATGKVVTWEQLFQIDKAKLPLMVYYAPEESS